MALYLPSAIFVFLLAYFKNRYGISSFIFFDDPAVVLPTLQLRGILPFFAGVASNIGLLFWNATLVLCFFSYYLLRKKETLGKIPSFLLFSGLLTTLLLLDDLFLFHEALLQFLMKPIHVDEKITFSIYGLLAVALFVKFRGIIPETDYLFLLLAFVFFGVSLFVDLWVGELMDDSYFIEEVPKLYGIISWFGYYSVVSYRAIKNDLE